MTDNERYAEYLLLEAELLVACARWQAAIETVKTASDQVE